MKILKTAIGLITALMIFVLPLTVSATGEDPDTSSTDSSSDTTSDNTSSSDGSSDIEIIEEFSLTLQCKLNGSIPKDTEFVFSVTEAPFTFNDDDAVVLGKETDLDDFKINTKDDVSGKKSFTFPEKAANGGYYYCFKLKSCSNSSAVIDLTEIHVTFFTADVIKAEAYKNGTPIEDMVFINEPALFTFNCTPAASVSVTTEGCEAFTKVYDGKLSADLTDKNYKLVGVADGDEVKLSFEKAEFDFADVKTASKITVSGLKLEGKDAAKYALSVNKLELGGNITKRPITVTADNLVMTLGQAEPALTYKLSEELIKGNTVVGAPVRASGDSIGSYVISRGTLSFGDNYEITFVEGSLTVSNFSFVEIKDPASSIKVSGYFDPASTIKVTALDPDGVVYTTLANCTGGNKIVSSYDIVFTNNGFDGDLTVTFPIDSKYEGMSFSVYQQMSNGSVACYTTKAVGGLIAINTSECSQFMLAVVNTEEDDDGSSVGMTILKIIIIVLAVIIGLALIIALFFFGMIFFNKTEQLKAIIRAIRRLLKK